MIKALIFDLGGVIVPLDFTRGYALLEHQCRIPADEIPGRIAATDLVRRYESGQVGSREFVTELCATLDLNVTYEAFRQIWYSIFLPHTLIADEMLAALGRRYPLILLSNTNEIHFEMLEEGYPILRHFKRKVLSYKVGAVKPSPVIYEAAVAQAGCSPSECFFTDDIEAYVRGACDAGIDAVQFRNSEQLERELRARGVEW